MCLTEVTSFRARKAADSSPELDLEGRNLPNLFFQAISFQYLLLHCLSDLSKSTGQAVLDREPGDCTGDITRQKEKCTQRSNELSSLFAFSPQTLLWWPGTQNRTLVYYQRKDNSFFQYKGLNLKCIIWLYLTFIFIFHFSSFFFFFIYGKFCLFQNTLRAFFPIVTWFTLAEMYAN